MVNNKFSMFSVLVLGAALFNTVYADNRLVISPGVMYFDYEERDENGSFLDGETGPVLGVRAAVEWRLESNITGVVFGSIYSGTVDYDGHTQSGTPVQTDTDANYFTLGVAAKTPIQFSDFKTNINVGYAFKRWERDIQPIGVVSGLYEVYQWEEISLGADVLLVGPDSRQWNLYAGVFQTREPNIVINLEADGDGKPKLFMGTDTGMQFSAQWMGATKKTRDTGVKLTYKTWKFGRSNSQSISGGREITEPKSRTQLIFLELVMAIPL